MFLRSLSSVNCLLVFLLIVFSLFVNNFLITGVKFKMCHSIPPFAFKFLNNLKYVCQTSFFSFSVSRFIVILRA